MADHETNSEPSKVMFLILNTEIPGKAEHQLILKWLKYQLKVYKVQSA